MMCSFGRARCVLKSGEWITKSKNEIDLRKWWEGLGMSNVCMN